MEHVVLKSFCNLYSLTSLINNPTCWKNLSFIDLILPNNPKYFQNYNIIERGLSHFHKIIFAIMKTTFHKLKPEIIVTENINIFPTLLSETLFEELSQVSSSDELVTMMMDLITF